jgi:hypothetical protein
VRRLAERHEQAHLATFPTVVDLSAGTREDRERRTQEAVRNGAPVIYQAALRATIQINGSECEIVGEPDFLLHEAGRYVVRDSKIARRITEQDHPEILRQLELYGWLHERGFGQPPLRLEVHRGTGDIVQIPYDGGRIALELVRKIVRLKDAGRSPTARSAGPSAAAAASMAAAGLGQSERGTSPWWRGWTRA